MGKRPYPPPQWAIRTAKPGDRGAAVRADQRGTLWTNWDPAPLGYAGGRRIHGPPRDWAKAHGWPTPWFAFERAFLTKMLASDESFDLAVADSGVKLYLPKKQHNLSHADLERLDALYEESQEMGALGRRPTRWGKLVEELREIRRAVEAGVEVTVGGQTLADWESFYSWAHGRYRALEDGYDSWIGDDRT